MKVKAVQVQELDSKRRLLAPSYLCVEDHRIEISALVVVKSKKPNGEQINAADRIKVKFDLEQVQAIVQATGAKTTNEVREHVVVLLKDNIVHALTEATRKR